MKNDIAAHEMLQLAQDEVQLLRIAKSNYNEVILMSKIAAFNYNVASDKINERLIWLESAITINHFLAKYFQGRNEYFPYVHTRLLLICNGIKEFGDNFNGFLRSDLIISFTKQFLKDYDLEAAREIISWQTLPISEMRKLKQLKMVLLIIKTLNTDIGIEVAPEFQQWLELEIIFQF